MDTTLDTRPTPTAGDMGAVETLARKEHAARAALDGWRITCTRGTRPLNRLSWDLDPEQPVLINGSTLAWSTGIEMGDTYEVRLGTIFGPSLYVRTVVPCTEGNLDQRRAHALATSLHDALVTLHAHTEDVETRGSVNVLRGKAGRIVSRLARL